jgi:glycosyltransferase involved in cell wall biosynthesis
MRLSVVIPSWNDLPQLQRCLTSLREQNLPGEQFEVVIVDDGSTDGTADWLRQQSDVTAVVLDENFGRSAARNAGLKKATGEQIVFLDADLTVPEDYLILHLKEAARGQVSLGRVHFAEDSGRTGFQRYMETRGAFKHRDGSDLPPRYFVTCNAMVPLALLQSVGGFDERMRHWGGEDMDMGLRLAQKGARFSFNTGAMAYHHQQRSFEKHLRNMEVFGEHNLPLLLDKHPGLARELQVRLLLPGGSMPLRLLFWSGLSGCLLNLLKWTEKVLRSRRLPDRLYDLAIFLATARGLKRGNTWRS